MHFSTISAAILSGAVLASAAPAELGRRACSYLTPDLITQLSQADPNTSSGPTSIVTNQDEGKTNQVVTEISFPTLPQGAYGCQLELAFQPGQPSATPRDVLVDLFSLDRHISTADTWSNAPAKVSLVGSTHVTDPNKSTFVINSFDCKTLLNFRAEISGTHAGNFETTQTATNGFRLAYNC